MRHFTAGEFWKHYDSLPIEIRLRADKQFSLLKQNPHHPSLQFKKIHDIRGGELWSARVTLSHRAVAWKFARDYYWFWIGSHEVYDSLIR